MEIHVMVGNMNIWPGNKRQRGGEDHLKVGQLVE